MKNDILLAKSFRSEEERPNVPAYARLDEHLKSVELAGRCLVETIGRLTLNHLGLETEAWHKRLQCALPIACLCHDVGKANDGFQEMVKGVRDPRQQPVRHELLSTLLIEDKSSSLRTWIQKKIEAENGSDEAELLLNCIIGAIAGHHVKLDDDWAKAANFLRSAGGGCGFKLHLLLSHPDLKAALGEQVFHEDATYSLIPDKANYLGTRRSSFNKQSRKWSRCLEENDNWRRFAAALKALVMAADAVGSATAPHNESIERWVRQTLSNRINASDMQAVVEARLKGYKLRPFQSSIGASRRRVTLVEAGCGTGKTVAAYEWAKHHAEGKKLFFCYPTTGTATEGFHGYVHETEVEAALIHSRAIVDLEGIAPAPDEEDADGEKEQLLRIASLSLWSPKVIICTADTVLALIRNNRRGLYNSPAIFSAAFVFDELHAYDERMFAAVIALIKALPNASFLLMTASLPKARKDFLLSVVENVAEVPSPKAIEELPRYLFKRETDDMRAKEAVRDALKNGRRVLWICNTVAKAQAVFDELSKEFNAATYHSRFKYRDRVERHRDVINAFEDESNDIGFCAVTTQVAEMSLDLDADLLISEVAPMSVLIQRLGRLNRRITPENPGSPRTAIFLTPEKTKPYDEPELQLAEEWIKRLASKDGALAQVDLADCFNALSPLEELNLDLQCNWLDSGWFAEPEHIRDTGISISVLMAEDMEACRANSSEIIKRAIPMNYNARRMNGWREYKGHLIAPRDAIEYDPKTGAKLR